MKNNFLLDALTLVNMLPENIPETAICPEPNGAIGFEWIFENKNRVLIVNHYGQLSWSKIINGEGSCGSQHISKGIPQEFLSVFEK